MYVRKKEGRRVVCEGRNEIIWGMTEMYKRKRERKGRSKREKPRKGNGALTFKLLFSKHVHHRHKLHKHSFFYKEHINNNNTLFRIAPQKREKWSTVLAGRQSLPGLATLDLMANQKPYFLLWFGIVSTFHFCTSSPFIVSVVFLNSSTILIVINCQDTLIVMCTNWSRVLFAVDTTRILTGCFSSSQI